MGVQTRYNGLSGLGAPAVRAVFIFSALRQRRSQWVSASARAALHHRSCLCFSSTGYLGSSGGWITTGSGLSGSPLCCVQLMRSSSDRDLRHSLGRFAAGEDEVIRVTYGHELWVETERTRSRIQADKMSFLRRVARLSLRDRVRR